eukprot:NODE_4520_length_652_cov_75.731343_g330_i6.p2 GENE.NODE_4520_length_652_cov_75.731343_g330_i6~~NODE_4520_length_652_cov_75.731343_g330_i6.p2  ORF type:complete len:118 (+),score=30.29 NODE_4520_length_652_cov_75.731343_g330_i6:28-354(+)
MGDISGMDEAGIIEAMAARGIYDHTPKFQPQMFPTEHCVAWRQTGGCDPDGELEPDSDRGCHKLIDSGASGFCECVGGLKHKAGCDHPEFNCADECEKLVAQARNDEL